MIAYLTISDASEGFNQIIDFLNGSSIKLQALVDKKKVVVTKASIRDALRLDDAEGVECLPNEEIFTELARMGYEKPSTKLNFYKEIDEGADEVPIGVVNTIEVTADVDVSVANDEVPTAIKEPSILSQDILSTSQALEITKLKQRVKKLERRNMVKVLKLKRMITDMDVDVNVVLEEAKDVVADDVKDVQDADVKDYAHDQGGKQNPRQKSIRLTWNMLIRELEAELNKNIDWDEVIDHVHKKAKEDPAMKRYQALKRKPQTDAQARNNMIIYLKNVKTKKQIDEEESRALKRLNETQAEKAAKRQKLDEEVEELKRHLQIMPNKEDNVYTEATTLALKFPVIDYEIYNEHNKPYYKIKRANGSHQLYLSFLNLKGKRVKCLMLPSQVNVVD
nr:hypothetical protein [Tanacetum cinerariifolium]